MVDTRSIPPFLYESQKEYYSLRREFALMVKFPFDPDQEEVYIGTLTDEGATAALAKMTTEFEAYKKKTSKSGTKKSKGKVTTTTVTKTAAGTTKTVSTNTGNEGAPTNAPADEATDETPVHEREADDKSVDEAPDPSDPSESSSSDDDDDDPRRRISAKDKQSVRGRTPR